MNNDYDYVKADGYKKLWLYRNMEARAMVSDPFRNRTGAANRSSVKFRTLITMIITIITVMICMSTVIDFRSWNNTGDTNVTHQRTNH